MLTIRSATPADVPLVVSLIEDLAEYEKLRNECVATEEALHEHLFGERRFAEVLVAEWNGGPAGFALFFHNYSTFLTKPGIYLEDLYVRPELRANGIGKALLTRLAALAVERGCGRLEWSVLKWNAPAIGFYERLGAVPLSEWQVYRLTGEALAALGARSGPAGG
ncbi:MAG: GNAT family N-acetyltransferase [Acidobacteria bacterium]|nr:GNAT family N-acetyltransferase [Acidobacteriota bacterium]